MEFLASHVMVWGKQTLAYLQLLTDVIFLHCISLMPIRPQLIIMFVFKRLVFRLYMTPHFRERSGNTFVQMQQIQKCPQMEQL